jgi:hypothetical protein
MPAAAGRAAKGSLRRLQNKNPRKTIDVIQDKVIHGRGLFRKQPAARAYFQQQIVAGSTSKIPFLS